MFQRPTIKAQNVSECFCSSKSHYCVPCAVLGGLWQSVHDRHSSHM